MRILHVCDSIIGGTGSYLTELLTLQARRYGAENIVLLMPQEHRKFVERQLWDSGIRFAYSQRRNRWLGMASLFLYYLWLLLTFRPNVVHAHSFGAGFVTRIFRVVRRPVLIFCPHGWSCDMDVSPRLRAILEAIEKWLARSTDKIIVISRHELVRAKEMGIALKKLALIPNGISETPPPVPPVEWHDDRLKLLFVGRFDRQKGLDVLIEALGPLGHRVALRIVGAPVLSSPPPRSREEFIQYVGWRDRDGVASEMKACDALVVPSRWEGFGLVAVEAMRLGKPVIASAVGGLREILDNGRFGYLVEPGNALELRRVLAQLDRPTLERFAEMGKHRFSDRYTAERMAAQIDILYTDVAPAPAKAIFPALDVNGTKNWLHG
ncbi:MAG: glycosyltransferase [Sphingomonadaceae bacterium]